METVRSGPFTVRYGVQCHYAPSHYDREFVHIGMALWSAERCEMLASRKHCGRQEKLLRRAKMYRDSANAMAREAQG